MTSFSSLPEVAPVGPDASLAVTLQAPTASAGFGSPGTDRTVKRIDLNDAFIRHPQATFLMRTSGAAMREAGIDDGDVVLVDRSLTPLNGNIVVAVVDGELLCRRFFHRGLVARLEAASAGTPDIVVREGEQLEVWGVVTTVIRSLLG